MYALAAAVDRCLLGEQVLQRSGSGFARVFGSRTVPRGVAALSLVPSADRRLFRSPASRPPGAAADFARRCLADFCSRKVLLYSCLCLNCWVNSAISCLVPVDSESSESASTETSSQRSCSSAVAPCSGSVVTPGSWRRSALGLASGLALAFAVVKSLALALLVGLRLTDLLGGASCEALSGVGDCSLAEG